MQNKLSIRPFSVALFVFLFFVLSVAALVPQFVAAQTTPKPGDTEYAAAKNAFKAEKQAQVDLTVVKNTSPTAKDLKDAQTKYDDAKAATDAAIDKYSGITDANVQAAQKAMGTPPTREQTKALRDAQAAVRQRVRAQIAADVKTENKAATGGSAPSAGQNTKGRSSAKGQKTKTSAAAPRYDSPPIAANDDYWGSMLRYAGEFSGFRIAAGVGYAQNSGHTDYQGTGFSTSGSSPGVCLDGYVERNLLHTPTGLFISGGFMAAVCTGPNFSAINPGNLLPHKTEITSYELVGGRVSANQNWLVQGGVSRNWFGFTSTAVYGEFGAAFAQVQIKVPGLPGASETTSGSFWGVGISGTLPLYGTGLFGTGVVQNIDAAAIELYLGYRHIDAGTANADFGVTIRARTDIDVVTSGARIKF